jgi:DNA-binding NarL/FixJ family response regulator
VSEKLLRLPLPPSGPSGVRRILIADDCGPFRGLLAWFLSSVPGIEIVAEASDGLEALETARACRPELVLMDVHMPHMDGLESARRLRAEGLAGRIILLSVDAGSVTAAAVAAAGADTIIDKAELGDRLGSLLELPAQVPTQVLAAVNSRGE